MDSKDYKEICEILDKICLDTVCVMEEDIRVKVDMEKAMVEGETNLAKCRYLMGSNSVSATNIPLNPEEDIPPSATVESSPNEVCPPVKKYGLITADGVELKIKRKVHPSRWFGLFNHRRLLHSQTHYRRSLELAIISVNLENHLKYLLQKFQYLNDMKFSMEQFEDEE